MEGRFLDPPASIMRIEHLQGNFVKVLNCSLILVFFISFQLSACRRGRQCLVAPHRRSNPTSWLQGGKPRHRTHRGDRTTLLAGRSERARTGKGHRSRLQSATKIRRRAASARLHMRHRVRRSPRQEKLRRS